ncbi:MAG: N-acetylmuramic acid 6-phosphate etherase [Roseinatronobacter sp.]
MIPTEGISPRYTGLENWPTRDMVNALLESQIAAIAATLAAAGPLSAAIEAAAIRLEAGGRLLYLGAGTSGRLAALDAAELAPTFGWPTDRAIALMAGGAGAFMHAAEGAEDDSAAAIAGLDDIRIGPQDVVIGLAASGRTPFVVAGLDHARGHGALTIAIGNNPDGAITRSAEISLTAATGAEVLAGSTRMKAGTAQKALLNCLSTGIFVRMGYVYRGRMVEMRPTNVKLHARAVRMVAELAEVAEKRAADALAQADGSIKLAIVMLVADLPHAQAEAALDAAQGRLHRALAQNIRR